MAVQSPDPTFTEADNPSQRPELLVSALLHLMSHYSANTNGGSAENRLASVIERHLKALIDLPDLSPVLRATCVQLTSHWKEIVDRSTPPPVKREKQSFVSRLFAACTFRTHSHATM